MLFVVVPDSWNWKDRRSRLLIPLGKLGVSYSVWSLDDTMNEQSELPSVSCQVHHSWQL